MNGKIFNLLNLLAITWKHTNFLFLQQKVEIESAFYFDLRWNVYCVFNIDPTGIIGVPLDRMKTLKFAFLLKKSLNWIWNCIMTCAELLIVSSIYVIEEYVNKWCINQKVKKKKKKKMQHENLRIWFSFSDLAMFKFHIFTFNFIRGWKGHENLIPNCFRVSIYSYILCVFILISQLLSHNFLAYQVAT